MDINQPGAHLDHMLRQTRIHHEQLSQMADVKANILLTLSSIVITLAAGQSFNTDIQLPMIVLMLFCLCSICFSAYSTMPTTPLFTHKSKKPDTTSPSFNLFFFGHFCQLTYPDFKSEMERIMNDHSLAYEMQVREIYTLGQFLAKRKYRLLRLAYLFFLSGIGVSALLLAFF